MVLDALHYVSIFLFVLPVANTGLCSRTVIKSHIQFGPEQGTMSHTRHADARRYLAYLSSLWSDISVLLQETEEDHAQDQQTAAAKIASQTENLSKLEAEAADLRSDLMESKVENERVMEALRRAGDEKLAQTSASTTLEVGWFFPALLRRRTLYLTVVEWFRSAQFLIQAGPEPKQHQAAVSLHSEAMMFGSGYHPTVVTFIDCNVVQQPCAVVSPVCILSDRFL